MKSTCDKRRANGKCEIYYYDINKYVSNKDRDDFGYVHCHYIDGKYGAKYYICDDCKEYLRRFYDKENRN
jgi:hypothetical protein